VWYSASKRLASVGTSNQWTNPTATMARLAAEISSTALPSYHRDPRQVQWVRTCR